jgi:hypothetical protein
LQSHSGTVDSLITNFTSSDLWFYTYKLFNINHLFSRFTFCGLVSLIPS